jgi:hypothetical protein
MDRQSRERQTEAEYRDWLATATDSDIERDIADTLDSIDIDME